MKRLVLESWLLLLYFEFIMRFSDFRTLHRAVRDQQIASESLAGVPTQEQLCHAVDLACVYYFRQVLCLQRSAVTTILLRRYGWQSEMVIGVQLLPFKSHAWVETGGQIINDKPYMLDLYRVLERC